MERGEQFGSNPKPLVSTWYSKVLFSLFDKASVKGRYANWESIHGGRLVPVEIFVEVT